MTTPSIALTIAGSDSSGGAGIQADLKTFTALGVYGASVITALTAQNTTGVSAIHTPDAEFVRAQMAAVLDDLTVGAIKTGMLANARIIAVVAEELARHPSPPVVVDPVMVATSGDRLLDADAVDIMRSRLFPRALVITPNLAEAAALLDAGRAGTLEEMERQGRELLRYGSRAVLMKGGHAAGDAKGSDLLITADGRRQVIAGRWLETRNTHGTGCTLSAAITAGLALGRDLETAVADGLDFVHRAMAAAPGLGAGHGPLNHTVPAPPA